MGGAGLRSWVNTADYSWFCSVAECATLYDVDFEHGRSFLKEESEVAHTLALAALGGPTYVNHTKMELLPPEEPDVLYQCKATETIQQLHRSKRPQTAHL